MRLIILTLCLCLTACQTIGENITQGITTKISDQHEADLLVGEHVFFNLDVAAHDYLWQGSMPGRAWVVNTGTDSTPILKIYAQYETHGDETCRETTPFGESISLNGLITHVTKHNFKFTGTLTIGSSPDSKLKIQTVDLIFSRAKNKEYWTVISEKDSEKETNFLKNSVLYATSKPHEVFNKFNALREINNLRKKYCPQDKD